MKGKVLLRKTGQTVYHHIMYRSDRRTPIKVNRVFSVGQFKDITGMLCFQMEAACFKCNRHEHSSSSLKVEILPDGSVSIPIG